MICKWSESGVDVNGSNLEQVTDHIFSFKIMGKMTQFFSINFLSIKLGIIWISGSSGYASDMNVNGSNLEKSRDHYLK